MQRLLYEGHACGQGRDKASVAFHASIRVKATRFRDQTDQGFGWMRVEMIDHTPPPRGRLQRHGPLTMSHELRFGPRRAHGRCPYVPCRDLTLGAQRLSPMTHVGNFPTRGQPRL
jgi:hypothetical protein